MGWSYFFIVLIFISTKLKINDMRINLRQNKFLIKRYLIFFSLMLHNFLSLRICLARQNNSH